MRARNWYVPTPLARSDPLCDVTPSFHVTHPAPPGGRYCTSKNRPVGGAVVAHVTGMRDPTAAVAGAFTGTATLPGSPFIVSSYPHVPANAKACWKNETGARCPESYITRPVSSATRWLPGPSSTHCT